MRYFDDFRDYFLLVCCSNSGCLQWVPALKMMYMIFYLKVSTLDVCNMFDCDIFLFGGSVFRDISVSDQKVSCYTCKMW